MSKRIYLAGPMSGMPDNNYPAFNALAERLRASNFEVENPAENPERTTWLGYMRLAVAQLATCDTVVMLPGWEQSRGAKVEYQLAAGMGLRVVDASLVRHLEIDPPCAAVQPERRVLAPFFRGRTCQQLLDSGEFKVGGSC